MCNEIETTDHLFASCNFTRWVLNEAMETVGSLVNLNTATSFDEAVDELNKVKVLRRGDCNGPSTTSPCFTYGNRGIKREWVK